MTSLALLFLMIAAPEQRVVTPAEQREIKDYFDTVLFDGVSARWRMGSPKSRADSFICGYVNAKNRMGAYTGWTPFFYGMNTKTGRIIDPKKSDVVYEAVCLSMVNGKLLD